MKRWLFSLLLLSGIVAAVLVWANLHDDPLPEHARADLVVVEKSKRILTLYAQGQPLKRYKISLGGAPVGAKQREGDQKTPEGRYIIDFHKADSAYFRALHVSYPGPSDIEVARKAGVSAGGAIMIHGLRNGTGWIGKLHRLADWTLGCIAVTNQEMAELWRAVPDGTPIELKP